jgi:hypothetical protein
MRTSRGYNTAASSMVRVTELKISANNNEHSFISHNPVHDGELDLTSWWQPDHSLDIEVSLAVDHELIRKHCKLATNDKLVLAVSTYCPDTKIQQHADVIELVPGNVPSISMATKQYEASGMLILRLSISVIRDETGPQELGRPAIDYSRIWDYKSRLRLSGTYSQMNVSWHDFSNLPSAKNALWRIYFHNLLDLPIEQWVDLDASNVIEIQLNEAYREAFEVDGVSVIALWSDLSREAIDLVMDMDKGDRAEALNLISESGIAGSWLLWLRHRFKEAFAGSPSYMWVEEWRTQREVVVAQIQSDKATKANKHGSLFKKDNGK